MYELFPVSTLIGTLFALAQLVASSEYTVMRVSGASLLQVGWALMRIGIPLSIVTFLAGEFVAPQAAFLSQQVRAQATGDTIEGRRAAIQVGILVQAGPDVRQHPQRACRPVDRRRQHLRVRQRLRLRNVRNAESGTFTGNGHWRLKKVKTTEIAMSGTRVIDSDTYTWDTVLRPSLLTVYQVAPEKLELNTLWENMRAARQRTRRRRRASRSRSGTRCSTRPPCW